MTLTNLAYSITPANRCTSCCQSWSALHADTGLAAYYKFNASSNPIPNDSCDACSCGSNADLDSTGGTFNCSCSIFCGSESLTAAQFHSAVTDTGSFDWIHQGSCDTSFWHWTKLNSAAASHNARYFSTINANGVRTLFECVGCIDRVYSFTIANSDTFNQLKSCNCFVPNDTCWHLYSGKYDHSTGNGTLWMDAGCKTCVCGCTLSGCVTAARDFTINKEQGGAGVGLNSKWDETAIFKGRLFTCTEVTDAYKCGCGREIY